MNRRVIGLSAALGMIGLAVLWVGGITLSGGVAIASKVTLPAAAPFDAHGGDPRRGEHLVKAVLGCTACHGADLGGTHYIDGGVGHIDAVNLTRGGLGRTLSDADLERAIRHGVAPDDTRLYFMPSESYAALGDADLRDVIAYVRSVPAVDRPAHGRDFGFGGRILAVTHTLPAGADHIDQAAPPAANVAPGPTAAYGRYLAQIGGCYRCHGADLGGGHYEAKGRPPRAPDITPSGIGTWTRAQFATAMRTGVDPGGRHLEDAMPWQTFAAMNDEEIEALYAFLKTVPPIKS